MAQVSLYIDDETMDYLRKESEREGTSVSKFVGKVIQGYKDQKPNGWPEGYWDLDWIIPDFPDVDDGCIDDSLDETTEELAF